MAEKQTRRRDGGMGIRNELRSVAISWSQSRQECRVARKSNREKKGVSKKGWKRGVMAECD